VNLLYLASFYLNNLKNKEITKRKIKRRYFILYKKLLYIKRRKKKGKPNKKGHDGRREGDTRGGLVDCVGSNRNAGLFP
jgi:hypothetical protein